MEEYGGFWAFVTLVLKDYHYKGLFFIKNNCAVYFFICSSVSQSCGLGLCRVTNLPGFLAGLQKLQKRTSCLRLGFSYAISGWAGLKMCRVDLRKVTVIHSKRNKIGVMDQSLIGGKIVKDCRETPNWSH